MRIRIYALAYKLGVDATALVGICKDLGFRVTTWASTVSDREAWQLKHYVAITHSTTLVDTSFLMMEGAAEYFSTYQGAYRKRSLLIPTTVLRELENNCRQKDRAKVTLAWAGVKLVKRLLADGLAEIRGEASDVFPDQVINRVVEQHLVKRDFIVLTNDVALMRDIRAKTNRRSVQTSHGVRVIKMHGRTHNAVAFRDHEAIGSSAERRPSSCSTEKRTSTNATKNRLTTPALSRVKLPARAQQPVDMSTGPLSVTEPLRSGSSLKCGATSVMLGSEIARGGEGVVFEVAGNRSCVAKIYVRKLLTVSRRSKLQKMVSMGLTCPAIAWPKGILVDGSGTFRGYVMPRVNGMRLSESLFLQSGLDGSYNRRMSVALAKNVVTLCSELHRHGVLIGDVNGDNILMDGRIPRLVDCDSFQVAEFPCPVHRPEYTAPELQERDFSRELRSIAHEEFAVAVLLFQIFMLGKHPYSHVGGGTMRANMKKCNFPYEALRRGDPSGVPPGKWRYMFAHLSEDVQEAFMRSFGKESNCRTPLKEWQGCLREYERELLCKERTFLGPKPLAPGYDLSLMPESRRFLSRAEIPRDGLTDFERETGACRGKGSGVARLLSLVGVGSLKRETA